MGLFSEQILELLQHGFCRQFQFARLLRQRAQLRFQQAQPLRAAVGVLVYRGYHHAFAALTFEQAFGLGQPVSTRHGHRVDRVKSGDVAYRWQQFAADELTAGNQAAQLFDDLPVDRLGGGGLDGKNRCVHVYQYNHTLGPKSNVCCHPIETIAIAETHAVYLGKPMNASRDPKTEAPRPIKGRGAASNPEGRFETSAREAFDDGWMRADEPEPHPATQVTEEAARSIISRNDSPDVPFDQSINPYRGCEHGCIYCFARPSHAYLNLSPGLDFETKLFAKTNAAELLRAELAKPGYCCSPINLGANTDPYQPIERRYRITRQIIEVLGECSHPFTIVTKNALVERDLDLIAPMAQRNLARVFISVTALDNRLAAKLEPRASAPHRRLKAIQALNAAGIPCGVLVAPIIPMITDRWLEQILERAHAAGARMAGYTVLRLPWELKQLVHEWLQLHFPERAEHVMSLVRQMRGGRDNDPRFGKRMRGEGEFAELIRQRFRVAARRHGFSLTRALTLDTTAFTRPRKPSPQGELF